MKFVNNVSAIVSVNCHINNEKCLGISYIYNPCTTAAYFETFHITNIGAANEELSINMRRYNNTSYTGNINIVVGVLYQRLK